MTSCASRLDPWVAVRRLQEAAKVATRWQAQNFRPNLCPFSRTMEQSDGTNSTVDESTGVFSRIYGLASDRLPVLAGFSFPFPPAASSLCNHGYTKQNDHVNRVVAKNQRKFRVAAD